MGNFFEKLIFFNTVEAKVIILTWYVKTNETMAINKFQRSRLTFAFSAKVAHIVVPMNIFKPSFLRNHYANGNQISYDYSLWLVSQNLYKLLWSHD